MTLAGLTNRQAAKLAGCTHKAIADAKNSGHLSSLPDGSVTPDAVKKWNASRRAQRGGYRGKVSKAQATALLASEDAPAERALAILTAEGIFPTRAAAELHRDSFVARLRQIEYQREAGKVVEVEHVARVFGEKLAHVRNRLLAIPAEQAPRLHRCKTVVELQSALLDAVTDALQSLVDEALADGA